MKIRIITGMAHNGCQKMKGKQMRSKFEFVSEAERRRYEKFMERKSRLNIIGANRMHSVWGLNNEKDGKDHASKENIERKV